MLPFDLEEYLKKNYKPSTGETSETTVAMDTSYRAGCLAPNLFDELAKDIEKAVDDYNKGTTIKKFIRDKIKEKGLSGSSDVYTNCGVIKGTFSKIRREKQKDTQRQTALALCIGLKLNLEEAEKFLSLLGYKFRASKKQEIAVKWFIENGIYNIDDINETLMKLGEEPIPKQRFLKDRISSKKM